MEMGWNPHGRFHVEYRWKKITKMGEISAKTYFMWNGQIPCGIGGQGKDLILRPSVWRKQIS